MDITADILWDDMFCKEGERRNTLNFKQCRINKKIGMIKYNTEKHTLQMHIPEREILAYISEAPQNYGN